MMKTEHIRLSDLNVRVKQSIRMSFPEAIWVIAEIGQLQENISGHCYLELVEKDDNTHKILARNKANIWAYTYRMLKPFFETTTRQSLTSGLKVLVKVMVEYHELYGISLNITDIDPAYTVGEMALRKQQVINQLMEDGVMEMNAELELPVLVKTIAIISSATAAGYGDFMNQLNENSDLAFHTCLFQASMQGDSAPASIMTAFDRIYQHIHLFDAVVVIRGGGASLDLSCFDDYELCFYAAQFPLPIITGIGHERDESVLDLVANTSLKTPTAVAAFLTGRMEEQLAYVNDMQEQVIHLVRSQTERASHRLQLLVGNLPSIAKTYLLKNRHLMQRFEEKLYQLPQRATAKQMAQLEFLERAIVKETPFFLSAQKNKLQHLQDKIKTLCTHQLHNEKQKLDMLIGLSHSLDPQNVLKKGYSITFKEGKPVKDASLLKAGDRIETRLYKGNVESTVTK